MSQIIPIYIPTYISDVNYSPSRVQPRLLYYNGQVDCEQFYVRLGELLSQLESLVVPILQNSNSPKFSQITFEKAGCLITYFPNQVRKMNIGTT